MGQQAIEDITLELATDETSQCSGGDVVPLHVTVNNTFEALGPEFTEIVLDEVRTLREDYILADPNLPDVRNRPVSPRENMAVTKGGRLRVAQGGRAVASRRIASREIDQIEALLTVPTEDGVYNETIEVAWHLSAAPEGVDPATMTTQRTFYYRVERGCITWIDSDEYHRVKFPPAVYEGEDESGVRTFSDALGFQDPYEDENGELIDENLQVPSYESDPDPDAWTQVSFTNSSSDQVHRLALADGLPEAGDRITETGNQVLNLTYCIQLRFRDNYQGIPTNTTGMEWWRPRGDHALHNFTGIRFEIWDRDWNDPDDYIHTGNTNYSADGRYACFAIKWDQSARGEDYPDLYIRTEYEVWDTKATASPLRLAEFCSSASDCNSGVTWRNQYLSNVGSNGSQVVYQSLNFGPETDRLNQIAMAMNGVQKFFWRSHGSRMTKNLKVFFDADPNNGTFSTGDREITIDANAHRRWQAGAHEAGHAYHKQLLRTSSLHNSCPSPHFFNGASDDHCAATEGYAGFVGVSSWYNNVGGAAPRAEVGTTLFDIENGKFQSTCDANARTEGQVTRALWDVFDKVADTDSPQRDTSSTYVSWSNIARIWNSFPSGSGNAQNNESDMNMRDFHHNSSVVSSDAYWDIWDAWHQNDVHCQAWP